MKNIDWDLQYVPSENRIEMKWNEQFSCISVKNILNEKVVFYVMKADLESPLCAKELREKNNYYHNTKLCSIQKTGYFYCIILFVIIFRIKVMICLLHNFFSLYRQEKLTQLF